MARIPRPINKKPKEVKKKVSKEEQITEHQRHRCINCQHAYLMQSTKVDPIVAMCPLHNNERQVARMYICGHNTFEERVGEMVIHPMIKLC